jgi:hypothetical protein
MTTERSDQDPAERKLDEWAEESRRKRGEASATAATADAPSSESTQDEERVGPQPSEPLVREERVDASASQPSQREALGATSTADLARAGTPAEEASAAEAAAGSTDDEGRAALFAEEEASGLRARWLDVQTEFVDDPRQAVQHADALVAELMQQLAETFASERSDLEQQWDRGGEVSTEDLRIALQRYRSFFDRLLSL